MAFKDFLTNMFGKSEQPKEKIINTIVIQTEPGGGSGTEVWSGYADEEYLDTLKGTARAYEFDKMARSDSQISMLLSAVQFPILGATPEVHPASEDDKEYLRHAALCRHVMKNDIDEKKFLEEALDCQKQGFSLFEKTHQINAGCQIIDDDGNQVLSSYIGLKKLGWLSPKTIETWNFNKETKILESVWQLSQGDLAVDYMHPVRHLLIFSYKKLGDNYEGISAIRPCYGDYKRKAAYHKQNAAAIEKSMPLPTAEVPAQKENTDEFRTLIRVLKAFTSHQQNYITYPAGWNVQLSNGTAYDPSKLEFSIDKCDIRMAKSFLANFLELGLSGTGAFALSNDLSDFFLASLKYIAGIIEKEVNKLFKELVILNFGPQDKYPTYKFTGIDDKAGKELADILGILVDKKVLTPDDPLEDQWRKRLGFTKKSDIGVREVTPPNSFAPKFHEEFTLSEKVRKVLYK